MSHYLPSALTDRIPADDRDAGMIALGAAPGSYGLAWTTRRARDAAGVAIRAQYPRAGDRPALVQTPSGALIRSEYTQAQRTAMQRSGIDTDCDDHDLI